MKAIPVKDKKLYEAVDGSLHEKKYEAQEVNEWSARVTAVSKLFVEHFSIDEVTEFSVDECIEFIAFHGDEMIKALTEE